ncbi:hypothetical protein AK812_SmicGene20881 [Symbiodinium microadriaticum]|uniref:Uncharacterized protein n=1 Tax=Symbiodinium microadriaticum TaxID=2951 RepID=A0A1Q9DNW1_SYMMI|nr:hypothetical protein AK812_SmicGene20881 [Symbiodinium microadriaticum]
MPKCRKTGKCDPRAILRIKFPVEYMRGENAAFSGPAIQTGFTFPQQVERRQSLNTIERGGWQNNLAQVALSSK